MADAMPTRELCERYADLYTGAITDVLDDRGLYDQTLDPAINPIRDDMTLAGVAYPCVGRPNRGIDPEENVRKILKMLGDAPENAVVIYETHAKESAQIGELSVECLMANKCRGAVLDGGARDLSFILENDFPVFSRYRTPADALPRWEIIDWNVDAIVGSVAVSPGDIIVGDIDGTVLIPQKIAEPILEEAEDLAETEDQVRQAVRNQVHPVDAYEEYGTF